MLAFAATIVGFIGTLVLTLVVLGELMPHTFAEWQRGAENRPLLAGSGMLIIALIGGYVGYRLGRTYIPGPAPPSEASKVSQAMRAARGGSPIGFEFYR
jgi:hypothetical protein